MSSSTVGNPFFAFFARVWKTLSSYEPEAVRRLRAENLSGLTGRVPVPVSEFAIGRAVRP